MVSKMAQYIVKMQRDEHEKYYYIYELEQEEIVLLPTKYLMHKNRSKRSPNTIKRSAFVICYYLNYMVEENLTLADVWNMGFEQQQEHFSDYLFWLKAGGHKSNCQDKLPRNETCNSYLKEVFRFYTYLEQQNETSVGLKVLEQTQFVVRNSVGIKRVLNRRSFNGYLKEQGSQGKTIEQDKIILLLQACANCRDQLLLLLLAETGFRIGELLGVRHDQDIEYEKHLLYVNFREDNENDARAKNAELRRAKVSDATFAILMFYMEEYKELIKSQEYLLVNLSPEYAGKPMNAGTVSAMLKRLEKKTGIKATPHMLRHYFANTRRRSGWKLDIIRQALGHRNIETTIKYLNITEEELIEASEAFYQNNKSLYEIEKLL